MNAVWQGSPCSVRDVVERTTETGWAYTTVKTLLQRLVDKGVLTIRMRGNTGLYTPRLLRSAAQKTAVRSLLQRAFDGAFGSLFQHLLTDQRLSAKDKAKLRELLDEPKAEEP